VQLRLEPSKLASVQGDICGVDGLRVCQRRLKIDPFTTRRHGVSFQTTPTRVGMRTIVEDERLVLKGFLIREDSLEDRPISRHNSNKLKPPSTVAEQVCGLTQHQSWASVRSEHPVRRPTLH
jgi:hypothetical protein